MSKYRIYRADFSDPGKAGRKYKWLSTVYFLLFYLLLQIPNFSLSLNHKGFSWQIYLPVTSLIVFLIVILFRRLRVMTNALKKIGIIEFTGTCFRTEIGDLKSNRPYIEVLKMEMEMYIREYPFSWNKSGSITRSLRIIYKDSTEENFILSDKSLDFKQKISVADSLKTLRTLAGLDIAIKDN
jgi:hypothetical protein